jgi:hypothetical protein
MKTPSFIAAGPMSLPGIAAIQPLPVATGMPDLRPLGRLAALHMAFTGAMAWGGLQLAGAEPGLLDAAKCALPAVLALLLASTSTDDRRQHAARLAAAILFGPILLAFWTMEQPTTIPTAPGWAMFGAAALLQLGSWAAQLLQMARLSTRVEALPGTRTLDAVVFESRLCTLPAAGWPLRVQRGAEAGTWDLQLDVGGERSHRVRLDVDRERREVLVLEEVSAAGAAPQTRDEADMRNLGDPAYDATRPDAQSVFTYKRQATMLLPAALAEVSLHLRGAQVRASATAPLLPPCAEAEARGEAMVTMLAALATRSGLAWQPALRLRQGRWPA